MRLFCKDWENKIRKPEEGAYKGNLPVIAGGCRISPIIRP
jgi:hypothetical protein